MSDTATPAPTPSPAAVVARWVWAVPPLLLLMGAPLWLHSFEPGMFLYLNALCAPVSALVWTGLSLLGNAWGVLGVTAPLLLCAPRMVWAWLCAAPFAIVFARGGKAWIESPRPAAVVDNTQMRVVGELLHNVSMPSGHTLTAFAVAAGMYFALPVGRRWRFGWLFALAAGTGLSRIAVGAHWPGDVVVGAALGVLAGLLGQFVLRRVGPQHMQPQAWSLRCVALLMGVAAYHLATEGLDFAETLPLQRVVAAVAVLSLIAFARQSLKPAR